MSLPEEYNGLLNQMQGLSYRFNDQVIGALSTVPFQDIMRQQHEQVIDGLERLAKSDNAVVALFDDSSARESL